MPEITSAFHNQDLDHEFDFIFGDFGQPSGALTTRISGNHLGYQPEDSYLLTVQSGRELELVPQETFTNFFPAELPFLIPGGTSSVAYFIVLIHLRLHIPNYSYPLKRHFSTGVSLRR